jgi:hypothetical protein
MEYSDTSPMLDALMWVSWNYRAHHRPHRVWWTCHFIPDREEPRRRGTLLVDGHLLFPPGTGFQSDHNPP